MTKPQTVLVEFLMAAPLDDVWRALRDPAEIARWFGWKYPGLRDEIEMIFVDGVAADDQARRLEFPQTGDTIALESAGPKTIVRLIRAAPADGTWDDIYDDIIEGWTTFLQQLRFSLERHAAAERETVYLAGRARAAGDPHPIEALGLAALNALPEAAGYETRLATGDLVRGSVWFRSKHQIGLTVDEFGDGLLVVGDRPASAAPPHGAGTIVLTLYGMDAAELRRLVSRWKAWWASRFEVTEVHPA